MKTVLDYIEKYGIYTLEEKPFNEVDGLVMCQIAYFKLDGFVSGPEDNKPSVGVDELYCHKDKSRLFVDDWYRDGNISLLTKVACSRRFGKLRLNYYVDIVNTEFETQFAAVTCIFEDKTVFLAYRGTDENIIGWKEDLHLAYIRPVQSQLYARSYLERTAADLAGNFYVGGHSKGGNLAVYAAMYCQKKVQEKIIHVYNYDGPGFRPEIISEENYNKLEHKMTKFVPKSSLVGILLESHEGYEVIESKSIGVLQHNPFTWRIKDEHFVRARRRNKNKVFHDQVVNEWILSLSQAELQSFIDTLYSVVSASEAQDTITFSADFKKNLQAVREAAKEIDYDTKKRIDKIIKSLFDMVRERTRQEFFTKNRERNRKNDELPDEMSNKISDEISLETS